MWEGIWNGTHLVALNLSRENQLVTGLGQFDYKLSTKIIQIKKKHPGARNFFKDWWTLVGTGLVDPSRKARLQCFSRILQLPLVTDL